MSAVKVDPRPCEAVARDSAQGERLFVAGSAHGSAHPRVVLAVRVGEPHAGPLELGLEPLLRRRQLHGECPIAETAQMLVEDAMRGDLDVGGDELAERIPRQRLQLGDVADVLRSELRDQERRPAGVRETGTDEDGHRDVAGLQQGQGRDDAAEPVVEGDVDAPKASERVDLAQQEVEGHREPMRPVVRDGVIAENERLQQRFDTTSGTR